MGKYTPLANYLAEKGDTRIDLSFEEVERMLGAALPDSAHKYAAWWANDQKSHHQARAWLESGYRVESPSEAIRQKRVVFVRME